METNRTGRPRTSVRTWGMWGAAVVALLGACAHAGPTPAPAPDRAWAADSVAVGYGTLPRRDVTGAVGSVRFPRGTQQRQVTNVLELLDGRVPGVTVSRVGNDFTARIRGANNPVSTSEPLFVLDGVPLPYGPAALGFLSSVDPNAVERIDVLKDAASGAIYGSRAGNGVIVITTRRPGR